MNHVEMGRRWVGSLSAPEMTHRRDDHSNVYTGAQCDWWMCFILSVRESSKEVLNPLKRKYVS